MRGIATPAALVMTSGIFASAVSGATAAAIGEPTMPSSACTRSRVINSCATRLPTSGAAVPSPRLHPTLPPGGRYLFARLHVQGDALFHFVAGLGEEAGVAVDEADLDRLPVRRRRSGRDRDACQRRRHGGELHKSHSTLPGSARARWIGRNLA